MSYELKAMRLLQRWAAWQGDKKTQEALQRESWDLIFEYTDAERLKSRQKSARYYQRKKAGLVGKKSIAEQQGE